MLLCGQDGQGDRRGTIAVVGGMAGPLILEHPSDLSRMSQERHKSSPTSCMPTDATTAVKYRQMITLELNSAHASPRFSQSVILPLYGKD